MQVIKEKFEAQLAEINVCYDMSQYDGKYTISEARGIIPDINAELIAKYKSEIRNKIAI